jgi:hypothetical protein
MRKTERFSAAILWVAQVSTRLNQGHVTGLTPHLLEMSGAR